MDAADPKIVRGSTEAIRRKADGNSDSGRAKRRFFDRIQNAPGRHTGGVIRWSCEELHER